MTINESCGCGAQLVCNSESQYAHVHLGTLQEAFHKKHEKCSNVVTSKIRAMKLTPGKSYLLITSGSQILERDFKVLRQEFKDRGIKALILAVRGSADDIKIMEFKGGEQNHAS